MAQATQTPKLHTEAELAKQLELIAQMLAKAESTGFPAEAEMLQERAETLMVRYGIDKAAVDYAKGKRGETREAIIEVTAEIPGTFRTILVNGFGGVVESFGTCTTLMMKGRTHDTLYIIGSESDVRLMKDMVHSLHVQAIAAMQAWWKLHNDRPWMSQSESRIERRQYLLAFCNGAARRVRDSIRTETRGEANVGTALVLMDRKDRAIAKASEMYPSAKAARSSKLNAGSAEARAAGYRAGQSADVGSKRVGAAARGALVG